MAEILKIEHLKKYFIKKKMFTSETSTVKAVDDISFSIKQGEVFVLAGESGSGKSTIAKLILKSLKPDSGKIIFEQQEIDDEKRNLQKIRMNCQMIHQDPYDSINPRMRIKEIISEPLEIHNVLNKDEINNRILEVLREVKLEPAEEISKKYPHMLSGGQRQRVVLARALAIKPKIILADEPVSMLDVSIRAEILELMRELQKKFNISFVYITHDLATAKYFGQNIGILYLGKIVEIGPINQVLDNPKHPYTQALIDAISEPNPENLFKERNIRIKDEQVVKKIEGCKFRGRCPYEIEKCTIEPNLEEIEKEHYSACHVKID
ncbi:MAG: ABC transporter ATP-binding protein [Nitrosopumilus sp.]|nr:MAG: ABC transporter ATP-binding protein [Candidatus Nitrosomarinus sp.]